MRSVLTRGISSAAHGKRRTLKSGREKLTAEMKELDFKSLMATWYRSRHEEEESEQRQPLWRTAVQFYTAPVTKFCMHTVAYLTFLACFTISSLETDEGLESTWGLISFQFMICYALEAYRQLVTQRATWRKKLRLWAMSEWNIIELTYLSVGLVSFPLTAWEETRHTAIALNCSIVILMWVRLLRFYQASSKLGPMWIMIRKMFAETMWFMAIFSVVIIACGICLFVINTDYDTQPGWFTAPHWVFLRPLYMFISRKTGIKWLQKGDNEKMTEFIVIVSLLLGSALMLNLLVAIYGGIFKDIIEKSDVEWKTEKYWLMKDFKSKTFLPPPVSIIETLFLWCWYLCFQRGERKAARGVAHPDRGTSFLSAFSGMRLDPRKPREEPPPPPVGSKTMEDVLDMLESHCVAAVLKASSGARSTHDLTLSTIQSVDLQNGKLSDARANVEASRRALHARRTLAAEQRREQYRQHKH